MFDSAQLAPVALMVAILAPVVSSTIIGLRVLIGDTHPGEQMAYRTAAAG